MDAIIPWWQSYLIAKKTIQVMNISLLRKNSCCLWDDLSFSGLYQIHFYSWQRRIVCLIGVVPEEDKQIYLSKETLTYQDICEVKSDISSVEFIVVVSTIFIDTLLNKKKITKENIHIVERTLKQALMYFEEWFKTGLERKNLHCNPRMVF